MSDVAESWSEFHKRSLGKPSRELLRRTLGCFALEQRAPGVAVDLGCGSGADTLELLQRGWTVHAVDAEPTGLDLLRQAVPPEAQARLHTHLQRFEEFEFPPCDLVWAGYALPFCPMDAWPLLLRRIVAALEPGGRFAGDLFGPKHAFADSGEVFVINEHEARRALVAFEIEAFDVENGYRPSGGELTRWHAFGFAARKRAA